MAKIATEAIHPEKNILIVAISDLALKGNSLLKLVEQPLIKDILTYLLQRVQSGNLANNYEDLLEAAKKHINRQQPATERSTL